jgi:uncharacterized protein (TIGR02147 family)
MTPEKMRELKPRDFRLYLQQELIRRCEANGRYSLRAFAKSLGESHATLSSILAGKRVLTEKTIIKLAHALKLPDTEINKFVTERANPETRAATDHNILTLDTFNVIADWYHDAILELTHTKSFQPDAKWIAKRLGITASEVLAAKERLERLDLLEIKNGKWIDLSRNNTTNFTNDLTSAALRKLQAKILALSNEALLDLPRTKRDHTSLTVAMQTSDLDEVKERIKKFRFELVEFIERKRVKPDAVYQFAFSAFPLTKND